MAFESINIQVTASFLKSICSLLNFYIFNKLLIYFGTEGVYKPTLKA